jgi:hypothetical protein
MTEGRPWSMNHNGNTEFPGLGRYVNSATAAAVRSVNGSSSDGDEDEDEDEDEQADEDDDEEDEDEDENDEDGDSECGI